MFGLFGIKTASFKDRIAEIADLSRTLDKDIADRKARLNDELDEVHAAHTALHSVVNTTVL